LKVIIQSPDKTVKEENAILKVGQTWAVGDNLGFAADPATQVIVAKSRLFNLAPQMFPMVEHTAAVFTVTDWYPINFKVGSTGHYRSRRPSVNEQAETMMEINKIAQIESNRLAAKKTPQGINEKLFGIAAIGLVITLGLMALPVFLPAFLKGLSSGGGGQVIG